MDSTQQAPSTKQPSPENRPAFDEHVGHLAASRQTAHRWLVRLVVVAFVLALVAFLYALYASFNSKSVGEAMVVSAWLYFFLAGALGALLLGLDTLNVGATVPPPFERSKYSFETGRKAAQEGWVMIGVALVVTILVLVGLAAVRAGRFGLEDWITVVVGFWVVVGLGAGALAILRRILR